MRYLVPSSRGFRVALCALTLNAWASAGEAAELKFVRPASAYAGADATCVVSGDFAQKVVLRAQWLLSSEKTVLARGEAAAALAADGKLVQFTFKSPDVARPTTLRLDVEISGQRVTEELHVFPATW